LGNTLTWPDPTLNLRSAPQSEPRRSGSKACYKHQPASLSAPRDDTARANCGNGEKSILLSIGILTANGTGTAPFLGIGANLNGPAKISFRMKAANGGEGSIELVPKANAKPEELLKFAYTLEGGDWQDINVDLPNKGGAAILRIYLPHSSEPVDIDWINVKPEPGKSTRWDF
jgi:hypothetical protein